MPQGNRHGREAASPSIGLSQIDTILHGLPSVGSPCVHWSPEVSFLHRHLRVMGLTRASSNPRWKCNGADSSCLGGVNAEAGAFLYPLFLRRDRTPTYWNLQEGKDAQQLGSPT